MKTRLGFLVVALALATFGYDGPVANPDDQIRYFTLFPRACYDELVEGGFNLLIGLQSSPKDPCGREFDWSDKKLDIVERCVRDKIEFAERCVFERQTADEFNRVMANGKRRTRRKNTDMLLPAAREKTEGYAKALLDRFGKHPGFVGAMVATEIRDSSFPSHTPTMSNAWAKASGGKAVPEGAAEKTAPFYLLDPKFPKSRVVPADHEMLAFYRWQWLEGDGWNTYLDDMCDIVRARTALGRKAFTMYDPSVRVPPLWKCPCGNVDFLGHWTYACPLPYTIAYSISEQQEMAKGLGKKVVSNVQGIVYRSKTAPKGEKVANEPQWLKERPNGNYITTPPDVAVEAFWCAFSRQMDGVGLFGWRAVFDNAAQGKDPLDTDYQFTNPNLWPAVKRLMREVGVPFGPLFKAVPERAPEVVVLESYATTLLAGKGSWGWDGPIYATGVLAVKAGLSPQTIYEDDIRANGIPASVKVILAPQCEVLLDSTFEALQTFQARGGVILADRSLVPGIRPDGYLPSFSIGGAADELKTRANALGRELRARVKSVMRLPAEAEQEDVIVHVRSTPAADYVFAINDRREKGDYIGQWGRCLEKGSPNRSRVFVNRPAGAVYDLVRHKRVPFAVRDGGIAFDADWQTCDGRLFLVTSAPLGALTVRQDGETVTVTSADDGVMIPVVLEEEGQKPYYGVVKSGRWQKCGVKGRFCVRSLADGAAAVPGERVSLASEEERAEIERRWSDWTVRGVDPLYPQPMLPISKPFKLAITRDPTFDHEIVFASSEQLQKRRTFALGAQGEIKVVELWLNPCQDMNLLVNGQLVGEYRMRLNPQLLDLHADITDYVRWNAENEFKVVIPDESEYRYGAVLKLIKLGR